MDFRRSSFVVVVDGFDDVVAGEAEIQKEDDYHRMPAGSFQYRFDDGLRTFLVGI